MKFDLIFFDAAGTLIEVRGRVGAIYARFARAHGLEIDPDAVHQAFLRAFRAQPPMAFPAGTPDGELRAREFGWWRDLVREVFAERDFPAFDAFFAEVFEYFRRPEAWEVFADVAPTLAALRARGVRLAVVSNFDTRLEDLLAGLEIGRAHV